MKSFLNFFIFVQFVVYGFGAPRSRTKTNYDQKQTGDYNIRLSLKDFQIIALLGEDTLGDIGNYDYNYDYSELTIKPIASATTTTTTTTSKPVNGSTLSSISSSTNEPSENSTTAKPSSLEGDDSVSSTTLKLTSETDSKSSTTQKTTTSRKTEDANTPDRIPVFVQIPKKELSNRRTNPQTVSILTSENEEDNNNKQKIPNTGDVVQQVKKCPNGLTRDKRGRCRKFRRPQFPFELARIASNLAAKLSPITNEETVETDSVEESY